MITAILPASYPALVSSAIKPAAVSEPPAVNATPSVPAQADPASTLSALPPALPNETVNASSQVNDTLADSLRAQTLNNRELTLNDTTNTGIFAAFINQYQSVETTGLLPEQRSALEAVA